ncbi:MAG: hypothetical protein ACREHE_03645 [Rhizomicrobium sp.]
MSQASTPRQCDGCTLCCKVFAIPELDKPGDVLCSHCTLGQGCTIYGTRPQPCRDFFCGWLHETSLGPEWKPDFSGLVLSTDVAGKFMAVHVDADRPDCWRQEPYYSTLRMWARGGARSGARVVVHIGPRMIQILPDGELAVR